MAWPPATKADVVSLSRVAPYLSVPARQLLVHKHGHLTHPVVYGAARQTLNRAVRNRDRVQRHAAQADLSAAIVAWGPAQ